MVRPMVPPLPMLRCSNFWAGVNSVRYLEEFCKQDAELGLYPRILIYRCLCECTPMRIKDAPLIFPAVTHKYGTLDHNIDVGPFLKNFSFPSIMGPFTRVDEQLG